MVRRPYFSRDYNNVPPMTKGSLMEPLQVIAGLVSERRDGTSRLYRADHRTLGSPRAVVEEHRRDRRGAPGLRR